jgi:hypothetical protein
MRVCSRASKLAFRLIRLTITNLHRHHVLLYRYIDMVIASITYAIS